MRPGHSRLLLQEILVSNHTSLDGTSSDFIMMAAFSTQEPESILNLSKSCPISGLNNQFPGKEQDWRNVIESAGFEVVKVWGGPQFEESVVEAIPKT